MRQFIFAAIFLVQLALAIDVSITTTQANLGSVGLDEGFYGASAGDIQLTIDPTAKTVPTDPVDLYVHMSQLLTSSQGDVIASNILMWKLYWASTNSIAWTGVDTTSSSGFSAWVPYQVLTDDLVLRVDPATIGLVSVTLGTQISRIPAVQPVGDYHTRLVFTVTQ